MHFVCRDDDSLSTACLTLLRSRPITITANFIIFRLDSGANTYFLIYQAKHEVIEVAILSTTPSIPRYLKEIELNQHGEKEKSASDVEKGGTEKEGTADRRSDLWFEKQEQIEEGAELCEVGDE